jgi:hypothetical protein
MSTEDNVDEDDAPVIVTQVIPGRKKQQPTLSSDEEDSSEEEKKGLAKFFKPNPNTKNLKPIDVVPKPESHQNPLQKPLETMLNQWQPPKQPEAKLAAESHPSQPRRSAKSPRPLSHAKHQPRRIARAP